MADELMLKPCPFCGGEVVVDSTIDSYHRGINCSTCGFELYLSHEEWNARPIESRLLEVNAALVEALVWASDKYHDDIRLDPECTDDDPCPICAALNACEEEKS